MNAGSGSILLVDDDPFVLKYVSLFLTEKGYIVNSFEKTQDAINMLYKNKIDVVLTDIKMPEISGIELLEKVRSFEPELPVILMTAYADLEIAIAAIKKGAYDFIMKPFEPEYLVHAIEKAIRYKRFLQMEKDYKKRIEEMNAEILNMNREMENIAIERTISMLGLKIADRIRNPVTIIGGLCHQIIKRGVDEKTRESVQEILNECNRIEKIVADFDNLVREKRVLFKREDLNEIVLSAIDLLAQRAKEKSINLSVNLREGPLMFNANKGLIKIAINHIINNSIDTTTENGSISVSTLENEESIMLTVKDTGEGIPQEDLDKIFDPFHSAKGRLGIGLPFAKQIISEHMGEIKIDSVVNVGTTVHVIFPKRWKEKKNKIF